MFDHDVSGEFVDTVPAARVAFDPRRLIESGDVETRVGFERLRSVDDLADDTPCRDTQAMVLVEAVAGERCWTRSVGRSMFDDSSSPIGLLIVDDHLMFAESLARLLDDDERITVVGVADSGSAALSLVKRLQPHVVLVDFQMPDQDGVAVTVAIKQSSPATKVVMLSESMDERIVLAALEAGCSGFLTKDRAASDVIEAVCVADAGGATVSPMILARLLHTHGPAPYTLGSDLSNREMEVLRLVAEGSTNRVIAAQLFLSVNTIRNYVNSILGKLNAHTKLQAVYIAGQIGLLNHPYSPSNTTRHCSPQRRHLSTSR